MTQTYLKKCSPKRRGKPSLSHSFANLIFNGKVTKALQLLSTHKQGRLLSLKDVVPSNSSQQLVKQILKDKHPPSQQVNPDNVIPLSHDRDVHPVIYQHIDASLIRKTSLHIKGAASPSGLNAHSWRRLCTSFRAASDNLFHSLAEMTKRLCTEFVDPKILLPFLASRLIALDKNPGVRPISVAETVRRLVTKAVLHVLRHDILDSVGAHQLCAGQTGGVESAVHTVQEIFKVSEAALLVGASNAFNSMNRTTALANVTSLCPSLAKLLINCYRDLYIDGEVIQSQEGTTQGDPLSMPFYALATIPLIKSLPNHIKQVWYADDGTALGSVRHLRNWWNELNSIGPSFGYFPNAEKTWLVVKDDQQLEAEALFHDTDINITCSGRPHLGVPLGTQQYKDHFIFEKVSEWVKELRTLSTINIIPHFLYTDY